MSKESLTNNLEAIEKLHKEVRTIKTAVMKEIKSGSGLYVSFTDLAYQELTIIKEKEEILDRIDRL